MKFKSSCRAFYVLCLDLEERAHSLSGRNDRFALYPMNYHFKILYNIEIEGIMPSFALKPEIISH